LWVAGGRAGHSPAAPEPERSADKVDLAVQRNASHGRPLESVFCSRGTCIRPEPQSVRLGSVSEHMPMG
jgi:hypothetical protein